ncbi:hypothetical protein [Candidatus Williamhamiltonella defendens]|uniref:hypothetical protein n=1 Tax=Candidatus Williamhamiltonella defendens TaxID=138072 RepID=UPI00387EC56C
MILDTCGGVLSGKNHRIFSLNYMHQIIEGLTREIDIRELQHRLEDNVALRGNIDPAVLCMPQNLLLKNKSPLF